MWSWQNWEGRFSPLSTYLVCRDLDDYVLWDWQNDREAVRIPYEYEINTIPPIVAPDEQTVAVPYRKRGSGLADRYYDYTHVQFWDVETGEMIRDIPVPVSTDSLEFLDEKSMHVIPRDEKHPHQESLILRWTESDKGEASVHY